MMKTFTSLAVVPTESGAEIYLCEAADGAIALGERKERDGERTDVKYV